MSSHAYAETSSATIRAGFPTPPEPTLGAPNLFILNNLLPYICKSAQTHKSTISKKMNLIYVAVDPSLYTHYSAGKAYPQDMYPFPDNVNEVPNLTALGWEICSEFRGIPRLIRFRTFWTPEIFHRNFIFPILKCVPANSEHVSSGSESCPTIDSSDFMKRKTFLPSQFFWPTMKISSHISQPVYLTMHNSWT